MKLALLEFDTILLFTSILSSAAAGERLVRRHLDDVACETFAVPHVEGSYQPKTIHWTGEGSTSEWIDIGNWQSEYLPSAANLTPDRVVLAARDSAEINCPTTYMQGPLRLVVRSRASLKVSADFTVGGEAEISSGATVVHDAGVAVFEKYVKLDASSYSMSNHAHLAVNGLFTALESSLIEVAGDDVQVELKDTLLLKGRLAIKLGPDGPSKPMDVAKKFAVDQLSASLTIDASDYTANNCKTALINFGSSSGLFSPDKIDIAGLSNALSGQIVMSDNSLYLSISGDCVGNKENEEHNVFEERLVEGDEKDDITSHCEQYDIILSDSMPRSTTVHWSGGGGEDNEWLNTNNWNTKYLPSSGVATNDRVIIAANDHVKVSCSAEYMRGDIGMEMRARSSLSLSANLNIGDYFRINAPAVVTHSSGQLSVGNDLFIGSEYTVSDDAVIKVKGSMELSPGSSLLLSSSLTSISARSFHFNGALEMAFDEKGISPITVKTDLSIGEEAILQIDASSYSGGVANIELFRFSSSDGSLSPSDVVVSGLDNAFAAKIIMAENQLVLEITNREGTIPMVDTTTIVFDSNGVIPTVVGGDLKIDPSAELTIDGSQFVPAPGKFSLFSLASLEEDSLVRKYRMVSTFDPMKTYLKGFPSGLWFEIQYEDTEVVLEIKLLSDYSEYSNRGRYASSHDYSAVPKNDMCPKHSWGRAPLWVSSRKRKPYTVEEFERLADYDVVMMNNQAALSRVKTLNPGAKSFYYINSAIYGEELPGFDEDNWLQYRIDEDGDRVPILTSGVYRRVYNYSVPEMRQWWIDLAIEKVSSPEYDGLFIDAVGEDPDSLVMTMLQDLRAALPPGKLMVANALRQKRNGGARFFMPIMDGSYMESWSAGLDKQPMSERLSATIQLAREALSKNKLILFSAVPWHCGWPCYADFEGNEQGLGIPLATFLMLAEENAFFKYQVTPNAKEEPWKWDASYLENLNMPLGKPLGPPVKVGNIFTRSFEYLDVKLDLNAEEATFIRKS